MHRILAALDTSTRAPAVVREATELAKQFGAALVLFRAVDIPPVFPPAAALSHGDELGPKLMADARAELENLASVPRALQIETTVRVVEAHDASSAILAAAGTEHADTIVVGSHGYRTIDRVLGTNAARVANRAKCTVVVVHSG